MRRDDQRAIDLGHGLCDDQRLVAEHRPAFLGQMRHHRREGVHEHVAGLGEGEAQIVGDLAALDRADRRDSVLANS